MIEESTGIAERIEALVGEVHAIADPVSRRKAEALVGSLIEMYGLGLARLLEIVHQASGGNSAEVFRQFAQDDLVSALLVLHGLHPLDLQARVQSALERVRPYLASHGGNVTLLSVAADGVRLRLEGNCHGCHSSSVTMKSAVERAIQEAAPEVVRIEVEGLQEAAPQPQLLQITRRDGPGKQVNSER